MMDHWADKWSEEYPIHAKFANGGEAYTTVEHAADLLDFIDRDKGVADLLGGTEFRTHMGTILHTDR